MGNTFLLRIIDAQKRNWMKKPKVSIFYFNCGTYLPINLRQTFIMVISSVDANRVFSNSQLKRHIDELIASRQNIIMDASGKPG